MPMQLEIVELKRHTKLEIEELKRHKSNLTSHLNFLNAFMKKGIELFDKTKKRVAM